LTKANSVPLAAAGGTQTAPALRTAALPTAFSAVSVVNLSGWRVAANRAMLLCTRDLCRLVGWMVVDLIRSRAALEAEIWTLRQQINVLRRTAPKKLSFSAIDRLVFVGFYRLFPKVCDALAIVKPETIQIVLALEVATS
jgi:hypothetical protein